MNITEFKNEIKKLHRFFYPTTDPKIEQVDAYYEFLKFRSLHTLQKIFTHIKQYEESMPRNLVSYCNSMIERENREAVGGKEFKRNDDDAYCFACLNSGFVEFIGYTDDDGRKWHKVYAIDDEKGGIKFVKKCRCPNGQKINDVLQATQSECIQASQINGGQAIIVHPDIGDVPF